jgi:hypothetical protein
MNMNTPTPQTEALQMGPKIQNGDFLESASKEFDYISVVYEDHTPK